MDVDTLRTRFPIFDRLVYINSCSQGALSHDVRAAYDAYLADWEEQGAPWEYWVGQAEEARKAFARLINARPRDVAVATSVSAAVSAVATGLDLSTRPRVVVTDLEFPTIGQIWHAQAARGAEIVHVAAEPEFFLERVDELVTEQTGLVSVTAVCYRNGYRPPLEEVISIAHSRGALVLIDAYQALGTFPIDIEELGADFVTGGALKYLLGSAGLAFMWVRPDLIEAITPMATGWMADRNIFEMDVSDYSPAADARRFESGTPPIPSIYAGVAGLRIIDEIGVANIEAHVRTLNARLVDAVSEIGGIVVTPGDEKYRGALICVRSTDSPALVRAMAEEGIVVSERDSNLRISAHFYNTTGDIDAVVASLSKNRSLLTR